jgi:hypothetical protein
LGNFINGGTLRGGAYGFRLEALLKVFIAQSPLFFEQLKNFQLADLRANTKKINFIHYLSDLLEDKFPG